MSYGDVLNKTHPLPGGSTPQTEPLPGQIANAAGGFYYEISDWERLDRFLIIGSDSGTYYVDAQKLTKENAEVVTRLLSIDGIRVVNGILEISKANRAPKKDSLIFALAMCVSYGNLETKREVLKVFNEIISIGTNLLMFCDYVQHFRGWGKLLRRCIANWFLEMDVDKLALQTLKYYSRNGWTLRDALRLSHPKALKLIKPSGDAIYTGADNISEDKTRACLFDYICKQTDESLKSVLDIKILNGKMLLDQAFSFDKKRLSLSFHKSRLNQEQLITQMSGDNGLYNIYQEEIDRMEKELGQVSGPSDGFSSYSDIIKQYNLPREAIDTSLLNKKEIWEALLVNMPETAMLRNLGKMTSVGLFEPFSENTNFVIDKLTHPKKLHPIQILLAMLTYKQGHGMLGKLSWTPNGTIIETLNSAFYNAFNTIKGTGKRILIGVDVSGSMDAKCVGSPVLNCVQAAAAMTLSIVRTEDNTHTIGFDTACYEIPITKNQRLDDVIRAFQTRGGTDIAMPVLYALYKQLKVDAIVIFTDNETWAGHQHAVQALHNYRGKINPNVKFIVVASSSTGGSICDPKDMLSMGIAGFDASVPQLVSEFIGGR